VKTVVGVHGAGQLIDGVTPSEASRALGRVWNNALAAAPAVNYPAHRVVVAYYAHHLSPTGVQGLTPDIDRFGSVTASMALSWGQQLGVPQPIAQGQVTRPVRSLISWVANRFGLDRRTVEWLVGQFFPDVATYFGDPVRRAAAGQAVLEMLKLHTPSVVLAHSLGSVVAYETLWRPESPVVDHLITVGSPLAMPDVVRERLRPLPVPRGARPPRARRWTDIADVGDLIAIPRPLRLHFDNVDTESQLSTAPFAFHGIAGYLKCAALATALDRR
jgi:hypothetical protein